MPNLIGNLEVLTNFFGYTHNFHDSEILKVILDRTSPEIIMDINIFEMSKGNKIEKSCIVTLRFENVSEMELKDFNIQNVIFGLELLESENGVKTNIESSFGLNGYIISSNVSISNFTKITE